MLFVLMITIVFVVISVYLFFQSEKLQRRLLTYQRENVITCKENKMLVESMSVVATRGQEFAKARLQRLQVYAQSSDHEQLTKHVELISPLINNYSIIFRECLKGKGRLKVISRKCFENQDSLAYKNFVALIVTSDKRLKRYWSSDNLNGFLFLVDALLSIENDSKQINNSISVSAPKDNTLIT